MKKNVINVEYIVVVVSVFVAVVLFVGYVTADTSSTSVSVGNAAPSISNLSLNGGSNITLTENTSVWATSTMTVADTNGCSEISDVTAQLAYAPSTGDADGSTCTYNANTCYTPSSCVATTTGNTCDGGIDTSVEYDCGFEIWYPARPTDVSSPGLTDALWYVAATTTDTISDTGTATNTSETIDIITLNAQSVDGSISYPSTSAGSDTGSTNQAVTHTNTGNTALDNEISGDMMCTDYPGCGGNTMDPGQQKFNTSNVTYSSLTYTLQATTTPATIDLSLATTTATSSPETANTYWGIAIPSGQTSGDYTGQNTLDAVSD